MYNNSIIQRHLQIILYKYMCMYELIILCATNLNENKIKNVSAHQYVYKKGNIKN